MYVLFRLAFLTKQYAFQVPRSLFFLLLVNVFIKFLFVCVCVSKELCVCLCVCVYLNWSIADL